MKYRVIWMSFILFGIVSADCLAHSSGSFADLFRTGESHQEAHRYADARAAYEEAVNLDGLTPDQTGQALIRIYEVCITTRKLDDGLASLKKALALEGISNQTRIRANILYGQMGLEYPWMLNKKKVRDAFVEALDLPEITPEQKVTAQKGLVKALMGLKKFAEARSVMKILMTHATLSPAERLSTQKSIGMTCALEKRYREARAELIKALSMQDVSEPDKADIQLQIALSYYEAQDYKRAKPELEKVLTMPGADTTQKRGDGWLNYVPSHEAKLRLLKMRPANKKNKTITALFIGSSMTLREYMPYLVEELSKSAPAGRPRIMSAMYTHGGIDIDTFWKEGDARDTARGKLRSMPWDIVVLETFHSMKPEDLLKYGKLFADLARSRKTEPVFYECHPTQSAPYPKESREFHERAVNLGKALNAPVAPVALAELYYVEAVPSANREIFYADYVHPSTKGVYLEAYCVYSAITGYSPVGLSHPSSMSDEEAKAMQEAAWKAVRETNPDLKLLD